MSNVPVVSSNWGRTAAIGFGVIFAVFGVLGGWSALAKINQAVHAPGTIGSEFGRKTVQHLEGGIVDAILVKEGELVKEGQPLVRLKRVQAKASLDMLTKQRDYLRALEARALAELNGQDSILWPDEFKSRTETDFQSVVRDQQQQFDEKRQSLLIQTNIIRSRIDQLRTQIGGVATQIDSTARQIELNKKELRDLEKLPRKSWSR